jgi:hypothetical protein
MIKTVLEQWKANQEQKRQIRTDHWEQEKRWREEDRAAQVGKEAAREAEQARLDRDKAAEHARVVDGYAVLLQAHGPVLRKAIAVGRLSLTCHEDTWTFMARRTFGMWQPAWTTSQVPLLPHPGAPDGRCGAWSKSPNLPPGRIVKHDDGMQTIVLSGDNLVAILDDLHDGAWGPTASPDLANSARCRTLYERFANFLEHTDESEDHTRHETPALSIDDRIVVEPADIERQDA